MKKQIIFFACTLFFFSACAHHVTNEYLDSLQTTEITLSDGQTIETFLATTREEQIQGLSSIPDNNFVKNQGMLFTYPDMQERSFWMPDTYFDLDIFFLDEDSTVLHIERDMPHHPSKDEPPIIARTPKILSRYVLEMRSNSEFAKDIQVNDVLAIKWEEPF